MWAKLSDIWGRKPIILIVVVWFMLSSILCAAAVNMTMLIAGRALQGTAGGGLMQLVMIVVSDLFSVRLVLIAKLAVLFEEDYLDSLQAAKSLPRYTGIHVDDFWRSWPSSRRSFLGICFVEMELLDQSTDVRACIRSTLFFPGCAQSKDWSLGWDQGN